MSATISLITVFLYGCTGGAIRMYTNGILSRRLWDRPHAIAGYAAAVGALGLYMEAYRVKWERQIEAQTPKLRERHKERERLKVRIQERREQQQEKAAAGDQ